MDLKEHFREILKDLSTLEINTVVKENMTARKMPQPRLALVEIAQKYHDWLKVHRPELKPAIDVEDLVATFKTLYEVMRKALLADVGADSHASDAMILRRLERNSRYVYHLLRQIRREKSRRGDAELGKSPKPNEERVLLPLDPGELVAVRKIWDVGTEQVVMQTLAQLDGDVVTRVRNDVAGAEAGFDSAFLLKVHGEGVRTSLQMWQGLVKTVTEFFGGFLKLGK